LYHSCKKQVNQSFAFFCQYFAYFVAKNANFFAMKRQGVTKCRGCFWAKQRSKCAGTKVCGDWLRPFTVATAGRKLKQKHCNRLPSALILVYDNSENYAKRKHSWRIRHFTAPIVQKHLTK